MIANGPESGRGRAVKIYTKTGDDGTTGLLGRGRVPKSDIRIAAYGTVDELNAMLGVARVARPRCGHRSTGGPASERAIPGGLGTRRSRSPTASSTTRSLHAHVEHLEHTIDGLEAELEPLLQFILPGGVPAAAHLHLARTVCRRAERLVVELSHAARRGRRSLRARLPESAQRSSVRARPRGQPPRRRRRRDLERHLK